MRCSIAFHALVCVLMSFAARAAEPAPRAAAEKPDDAARTKAEAEATAAQVGKAYAGELARFEQSLKDNNLDEASAAARALIELSAEPGQPPWQPRIRTFNNVIRRFEQCKVFGSRHTRAFYEAALSSFGDGDDKADLTLRYGMFLYTYALVDDKEAIAVISSAFDMPGVAERRKLDLCRQIVEHVAGRTRGRYGRATPYRDVDRFTEMALAYARNNPAAVTGIAAWMVRIYGQLGRDDDIVPLYEKLLADKAYEGQHAVLGIDMANYLNRKKEYTKALEYLNTTIPELEGADKLRYQRLLADTYARAASRYYADPDPEDIRLAINVHRDIIRQIPAERAFEMADTRLLIAQLSVLIGDYKTAVEEAGTALAVPELAEKRIFTKLKAEYLLGQTAYAQGNYPEAVEILARAREEMGGIENLRPHQVPFRRDLVEVLVRGYCAVGELRKAADLSDDLLGLVGSHERARYQISIDWLKRRVAPAR